MKKLLKLALVVSMVVGLCMSSVAAATSYTTKGTTFYPQTVTELTNGDLRIELPVGTYVAGTYEVGAHFGMITEDQISLTADDTEKWYLVGSITLSASQVSTLKSSTISVDVKPNFYVGVSNIQMAVGSGNYTKYTSGSSTSSGSTVSGKGPTNAQLSDYSNFSMDVYANSRVTSIKASGSSVVVSGYMFENGSNNANVNTTKNWREIIFVNASNTSSAYAYRKLVTPVYSTWLNSNMTATQNGKYKLKYANYTVTVNPSAVYKYSDGKNTTAVKMASGTYYVYMRISNGTTTYLFPLVDRTLSDGTNMENSGTLPSGFTVYDSTTRALTYTVK